MTGRRKLALVILTIGAIVGVAAVAVAIVVVPERMTDGYVLTPKDRLEAMNAIRTTIVSGIGAIFVAGGLIFTARTFVSTREGQITDRYSAAIDHLATGKPVAVIGGIYSLERIGRDSTRDVRAISDVLCSIVRSGKAVAPGASPATEIVAALEVLSRLPGASKARQLDLRGAVLNGLYLPDLRIAGADLTGAMLVGAILDRADLRETRLDDAILARATLRFCRLDGSRGVKTVFDSAYLDDAALIGVELPGVSLIAASLTGVRATRANLREAKLGGAQLHASAKGSTDLTDANLAGATIDKANVEGVDLSRVKGLTRSQRDAALSDGSTRWPKDLG